MDNSERMQTYVIKNIAGYIDILKEVKSKQNRVSDLLWYRGQSDASYYLLPSALRDTIPIVNSRGFAIKDQKWSISSGDIVVGLRCEKMLDDFKRQAIRFLNIIPKNDFEWMFIAQHHGIPTRLLDWSLNPLVALFFALPRSISESDYEEKMRNQFGEKQSRSNICEMFLSEQYSSYGAAVFIIDPYEINKWCVGTGEKLVPPINVVENFENWKPYLHPMDEGLTADLPICIYSSNIDDRINSQYGHFTLHGSFIHPLEHYLPTRPSIHKIFIPYYCINEIRNELFTLGITESVLFPGLDSLANDIKRGEEDYFTRIKKEGYF